MLACRSRDTRPEILLRSAVHRLGLRFRVCIRPVPGVRRTADLVFTRQRLAVFVDGCFWHGCPEHYTAPKTNTGYWAEKVHANRRRDRDTDARLEEQGWTVMRFWEHQDPREAAHLVRNEVAHLGRRTHQR